MILLFWKCFNSLEEYWREDFVSGECWAGEWAAACLGGGEEEGVAASRDFNTPAKFVMVVCEAVVLEVFGFLFYWKIVKGIKWSF